MRERLRRELDEMIGGVLGSVASICAYAIRRASREGRFPLLGASGALLAALMLWGRGRRARGSLSRLRGVIDTGAQWQCWSSRPLSCQRILVTLWRTAFGKPDGGRGGEALRPTRFHRD
jgi:hypothetical protein